MFSQQVRLRSALQAPPRPQGAPSSPIAVRGHSLTSTLARTLGKGFQAQVRGGELGGHSRCGLPRKRKQQQLPNSLLIGRTAQSAMLGAQHSLWPARAARAASAQPSKHPPGVGQLAGPPRRPQVAAALRPQVARMVNVLGPPLGVGCVAAQRVQRACGWLEQAGSRGLRAVVGQGPGTAAQCAHSKHWASVFEPRHASRGRCRRLLPPALPAPYTSVNARMSSLSRSVALSSAGSGRLPFGGGAGAGAAQHLRAAAAAAAAAVRKESSGGLGVRLQHLVRPSRCSIAAWSGMRASGGAGLAARAAAGEPRLRLAPVSTAHQAGQPIGARAPPGRPGGQLRPLPPLTSRTALQPEPESRRS